ncbi:hypothetical protein OHB01_15730 [Microbispora hainanensis]|uniref:Uncharacterized protein n=1 Tax=Microbispora hainanensis TaxID=568844 RepID=A0ABZ1SIH4_9ACTN|nr:MULTISPECIES: hypothetical protein [Microbispora]
MRRRQTGPAGFARDPDAFEAFYRRHVQRFPGVMELIGGTK